MIYCDLFDAEHEFAEASNGTWDLVVQVAKMHTELPVYFEVIDKHVVLDETADDSPVRFCEGYLSRGGGAVALAIGQDIAALSGIKPPPPLLSEGATIVVRDVPKKYQNVALATRVAMVMRGCCKLDKIAVQRDEQKQEMQRLSERIEALSESLDALERDRDNAERLLRDGRSAYRVLLDQREPVPLLYVVELFSLLEELNVSIVRCINLDAIILAPPRRRPELDRLFLKVEEL